MWTLGIILLIVGALVWLVYPLRGTPEPWAIGEGETAVKELRREKIRLLRLLKDLDLEKDAGSIEDREYQELRDSFLGETALVNRRLETLGQTIESPEEASV